MRLRQWFRILVPFCFTLIATGANAAISGISRDLISSYFLEWNGQYGGPLIETSGGYAVLNVMPSNISAATTENVQKEVFGITQTPLVVVLDLAAMSQPVRQWLVGDPVPATLGVVRRNGAGGLVDRLILQNATVGALEVAALSPMQAATVAVTFVAGSSQVQPASGAGPASAARRALPPQAVRVNASGQSGAPPLDHEIRTAEHVGFVRETTGSYQGDFRTAQSATRLNCNDVEFIVPHANIGSWYPWYKQALDGNAQERPLGLELVGSDGIARPFVTLENAGIRAFEPFNDPTIGMAVKASVYCEGLTWSVDALGN